MDEQRDRGELRRRAASERVLSYLRIGIAAYAAFLLVAPHPGPAPPRPALLVPATIVVCVLLVGATVAVHALLPRVADEQAMTRLARSTFVADVVLVSAIPLVHAHQDTYVAAGILLVLPVIGALKYQFSGALAAVVAIGAEEALRQVLRQELFAAAEPSWPPTIFLIVLATLVGLASGQVASRAEHGRLEAEQEAARTQLMAHQAEAANRDLSALHRVILAGIGGREQDVVLRMLTEIATQLELPAISVVLHDDQGRLYHAGSSSPELPRGSDTVVDPGGPIERALLKGAAQIATPEEMPLLHHGLTGARSELAAPIRSGDRAIGALVVESTEPDAFRGIDLAAMQRLADQMGLAVEAARAYEKEAGLAERYRELDRLKTDFVAITSHELRTPLTAILGFTETLRRRSGDLSEPMRVDMLRSIERQSRRLARLVDDLDTVGRLDAGTISIAIRPTRVDEVVAEVLATTRTAGKAAVKGQPGVLVAADPERLHQVLSNLILNAFEHGGDEVEIAWTARDHEVDIRVRDRGPGVPSEHADRVFDRFFQAQDVMGHARGSGLGLPIARELSRMMGGDLALEQAGVPGACFVVRLPPPPT